jgi:hypothetical protein
VSRPSSSRLARMAAPKKPKKLPHLNVRLAWLSKELQKPKSDHLVIEDMATQFKITASMAKKYLDALYAHWEAVAAPEKSRGRLRVIDILYRAIEGSEAHFQFSAMVNAADKLARLHGLYEPEKLQVSVSGNVAVDGPEPNMLEQRLRALLSNPAVRERARKLGLDVDEIETPPQVGESDA